MSPHDVATLVRRAYESYNTRELAAAARLYSEELELRNVATGDLFRGREGYLQYVQGWVAAFPDSSSEIGQLRSDDRSATLEYLWKGTHTGALVGPHGHIPPTWRPVELRVCDTILIEDGALARVSTYFDSATLLRQMGLLPGSPLHRPDRRAPLDLYALELDAPAPQRNKAVVQRFVEQVLDRRNPRAAAELCLPNHAWHGGPLGELRDLGAYQLLLGSLFVSFPDLRVEVHDLVAEADRVVARATFRGTHLGDFQGIPPTGKRIASGGTSIYRVVDGRIAEEWWQHDLLGLMTQLDVVPAMVRLSTTRS